MSCTTDDVPCLTVVRQQCSIDIALCMYPLHSSLPACQQQKKVPYNIWLLLRPQAIKRSLKVRWTAEWTDWHQKKTCGSTVFSPGHPRQYSLAPAMLVCADRTRRGRFIAVWPQMKLQIRKANIYSNMKQENVQWAWYSCICTFTLYENLMNSLQWYYLIGQYH